MIQLEQLLITTVSDGENDVALMTASAIVDGKLRARITNLTQAQLDAIAEILFPDE